MMQYGKCKLLYKQQSLCLCCSYILIATAGRERAIIHLAMQEWEQYTCVKFRPSNSSDVNKLVFQNGIGYVLLIIH